MEVTEIILLAAGGVIFILSFLLPDRGDKKRTGVTTSAPMAREEVKILVEQEMDAVKEHVDDVVNEAVTYAIEKTERSLERLSNEKIMAINEYSDTVMAEIHRNHEEAVFLYDMLNSKHTNLKETVSMVTQTVKTAEETVNTFQRLVPESVDPAAVLDQPSVEGSAKPILKAEKAPSVYSAPKAAFVRAAEEQMEKEPTMDELSANNSNDRILQLYKRGMDKVSIARELGLGVGEVKLVIDLFDTEK